MEYDEEKVLTDYIWDHYQHLMTDEARWRQNIALRIMKSISSSDNINRLLFKTIDDIVRDNNLDLDGITVDRESLERYLVDQADYRVATRDILLKDHPKEIFINRCPNCDRIVRTPKALQCFWCGHDWHHSSQ